MSNQERGQLGLKVGGLEPQNLQNYGIFGKVNALYENCQTCSFSEEKVLNFIGKSLNLPPTLQVL